MKKRRYNTLGRRLLAVLREGGERKYAILRALAAHWGHNEQAFARTLERLRAERLIRERRRQGGVHLRAAS